MNDKITKIISSEHIMGIIAVVFVLTPLIIFSLFSLYKVSESLTDIIKNEIETKSTLVTNNINSFISGRITDARVISQADVLASQDLTAKIQYLTEIITENKWINNIEIIAETGTVIASSGMRNEKGKLFWELYPIQKSLFLSARKAQQGQVSVSEAIALDNEPGILFITPITDDDNLKLTSLLVIEVNLEHIADIVSIFGQGNIGNKYVYLVDKDGKVIVSDDPTVTFQDSFAALQTTPELLDAFSLQAKKGNLIYTDHTGDEVIASYANMAEFGDNQALGWRLIAIAPMNEITMPVSHLKQLLLVVGSMIALISGFLAYRVVIFFNRKLTNLARQELTNLARQADAISKGDYSTSKLIESKGEGVINKLVIAINRMQVNIYQTFKRLKEQKFILDNHSIVSITDTAGFITYANDNFAEVSGYSNEELIGKNHRKLNSGHHPAEFFTDIWQTISSGNVWQGEICNKSKNGELYWVFSTLAPNFDSRGEIIQYTAIKTNITAIKRTDELLRRSQKIEAIGELTGGIAHDFNNLLGIIIGNIDLMELNVEDGSNLQKQLKDTLVAALRGAEITRLLLNFSGQSEGLHSPTNIINIFNEYEDFIRKSITAKINLEMYISDVLWLVDLNLSDFLEALINLSLNARDAMPSGGTLIFEVKNTIINNNVLAYPIDLKAGEYIEIVVSDSGIGMNKETMNKIFDPFFTTKDKSKGTGLGLSMVFGFVKRCKGSITVSSEEGLGTIFKIYLPRSPSMTAPLIIPTEIDKQQPQDNEIFTEKSNPLVPANREHNDSFLMQPVVNELPAETLEQRRFVGSCTDLSEIKKQVTQLRQAQQIEAQSKLTSGIAHDFNNMQGIVLGYSELLVEQIGTPSEQIGYAAEINHAGQRWATLTRKLLSLARAQPSENETYNINQIIKGVHNLLSKVLTASIDLEFNLTENLWPTKINVNAFEDLLLNLCINLIHTMPDGGSVNITTANEVLHSEKSNQLLVKSGGYVSLSIADTRCGMSDVILEKVFEPFFTTKEERGTGLGLAQVNKFLLECGGSIELKSERDCGTQFKLYFPRDIASLGKEFVDNQSALDLSKHTPSILVVDDEKSLRELAKSILEVDGYKVETVSNGAEALIFLETHQVDLMFTDIIMPVMNGYQLAETTQKLYPNMLLLFTSGYHNEAEYLKYKTASEVNLLHKPYRAKDLCSMVSQILNSDCAAASKPPSIKTKIDNEL